MNTMTKSAFFATLLSITLFLGACSSSKNGQKTAPRKDIKGSWRLDKISYDGLAAGAKYKITLLDEGYAECLEGSNWALPNNGYGSFTINSTAAGCTAGERKIMWSYRQENGETIFQFKKLEEGVKAKNTTDGYKLRIVSANETSMLLQSEAASEGKMIYVNYEFSKH